MDILQWLAKLISFNTISSNSNMQLIDAVDAWFKQHAIDTHIIYSSPEALKANLFATIPAKNGDIQGGLILSAHTDVVPVLGQLWDSDPFTAVEKEGRIYGRGSCDMKGFLAVMLSLVPEFKKLNLVKPLHFSLTYDEEVGCIGVNYLLDYLHKLELHPEGCIVGEPTCMRPIVGEKARQVYHCRVQGLASHASRPDKGCNAVEYASQLISYISKLAETTKNKGPFDKDFDVPFTTITTNIVQGGISSNIIPNVCEFILEIRYFSQECIQSVLNKIERYINKTLLPKMRKNYPEAAIYLDMTSDAQGFYGMEEAAITQLVRKVTGIKERFKVSYSTEAGLFQQALIPTVICGPGTIEQAHRANEFVEVAQLELCANMLRTTVRSFCG